MKRLLIPLMLIYFVSAINSQLNAQKDKKNKTITLKIVKETDDGKMVIDTTFTLKDGEDLHKIMEKYGIKTDIRSKHGNTYDFEIEVDDSLDIDKKGKMVWVSADVDGEGHKYKVKSKQKNVIYFGDNDEVEVIKIKKGGIDQNVDLDENVIIEELKGDSLKITKKIIIKNSKEPKQKRIKKIYKYQTDSISEGDEMVFFSDDDMHEVFINKQGADNDSVEVFVKKIKKGKHGKHVYITSDDDFTWNSDEDLHFESKDGKMSKVKIEIIDPTKEDLNKLKLKSEYNKLDISDFFLFLNKDEDKMDIKFTSPGKGNLSVKIFDETGKTIFNDVRKQYEGKYKNEIKALKGTFIVQISQDKKYFVRKMILDWN